MSSLITIGITNGVFQENCWILADTKTREAVIIDPGEEAERFLAEVDSQGWKVTAVWLTHAHIDHIHGVGKVVQATGAPVALHPDDAALYQNLPLQASWFGLTADPPPPVTQWLSEGQTLRIGGHKVMVRHVPGHSPGHVAFGAPGFIVGGDVLFADSIGRTDLPGGDLPALEASIRAVFYTLPDNTRVLPGHGPETTIGREKSTNPYVSG